MIGLIQRVRILRGYRPSRKYIYFFPSSRGIFRYKFLTAKYSSRNDGIYSVTSNINLYRSVPEYQDYLENLWQSQLQELDRAKQGQTSRRDLGFDYNVKNRTRKSRKAEDSIQDFTTSPQGK